MAESVFTTPTNINNNYKASSIPETRSTVSLNRAGVTIDSSKVSRYQFRHKPPSGFFMVIWAGMETACIYLWVLAQTLLLICALTVLHFSTFSVMVCYFVNGVIRRRRELFPQKLFPQIDFSQ